MAGSFLELRCLGCLPLKPGSAKVGMGHGADILRADGMVSWPEKRAVCENSKPAIPAPGRGA